MQFVGVNAAHSQCSRIAANLLVLHAIQSWRQITPVVASTHKHKLMTIMALEASTTYVFINTDIMRGQHYNIVLHR